MPQKRSSAYINDQGLARLTDWRESEVIVEAEGVTVYDPEVVCNSHSDDENSEELKALKEEKEQLERKCASLELENEMLGSECPQLLDTNGQLVLDNCNLPAQKFGAY